jgi:tetratricopeptide (TPR) repeat protein
MSAAGLDFINRGREEVALRADAFQCDVDELTQALAEGDPATLGAALSILGADRLLEDLELPGLYREWLDQARAQFDRTLAQGVMRRLERLEAQRAWREVGGLAEAYLRRDPLDEGVVAMAIRSDIALGATAAAHRRFHTLRAAMEREFGVAPGAAIREALAQAPPMGETPAPTGPTAPVVPAPPSFPPGVSASVPLVIVCLFDTPETTGGAVDLAAMLHDEVLAGLSRFTDLHVRTDPRRLDHVMGDAAGERTDAYVLGASVRQSKDGPRLIAQMLVNRGRRMIWSERFALASLDPAQPADEIVAKLVGAVLPTIHADLARHAAASSHDHAYARDLLTRGVEARARTFAEARAAADLLEALAAADASSNAPLIRLVYLYNTDFGFTRALSSGLAERARAFELSKAALAMDRSDGQAYTATGWCYLRRRQWDLATRHFEQAVSLNPYHANRLLEIGSGFIFLDDLDRAQDLLDRSMMINPSIRDNCLEDLGFLALIRGRHDQAESYLEMTANPEIWTPVLMAINAQMAGRPSADRVREAVARVLAIWPEGRALTREAMVAWISDHYRFRSPTVEARFLAAASETFADL